jgi:hypothetical protein
MELTPSTSATASPNVRTTAELASTTEGVKKKKGVGFATETKDIEVSVLSTRKEESYDSSYTATGDRDEAHESTSFLEKKENRVSFCSWLTFNWIFRLLKFYRIDPFISASKCMPYPLTYPSSYTHML